MAQFHCDHCHHQQSVDEEFLLRQARCPDCGHVGVVTAQTRANGWRAIALLCASGLLSFCATWMWVNAPVAEHTLPRLDAVASATDNAALNHSRAEVATEATNLPLNGSSSVTTADVADGEDMDSRSGPAVDGPTANSIALQDPQSDPITEEVPPKEAAVVLPVVDTVPPARATVESPQEQAREAATAPPKVAAVESTSKTPSVAASPAGDAAVATTVAKSTGQELFEHEWTVHDPLAGKGDGLGPVFNARSCVECHTQGGTGGSGANQHNVQAFEVLPNQDGGPLRSGVIHASSIDLQPRETKKLLESLLGSPKVPFRRVGKKSGIVEIDAIRTVFLNTPALWGNGLIDKISLRELQKLEFTHPSSGRFHQLADGSIGKFGWKAQIATLHQFVGGACAGELGLSNSVRSQPKPMEYRDDYTAEHDLKDDQLKSLVQFVADLPAPRHVLPESAQGRKEVAAGERLFTSIGCANCHVKDVGVAHGVYSDFRLHNISSAVTKVETYYVIDAVPIYVPEANAPRLSEWKTPPLWGLSDTAPYWHDGSAQTIRDAILKHDGEAGISKAEFEILTSEQQNRLLAFLDTLKAPAKELSNATPGTLH